jgi:hypothetical protein
VLSQCHTEWYNVLGRCGAAAAGVFSTGALGGSVVVTAGVFSTAGLGGAIEAEDGRLERGKYLLSKSALSAITVFLVVGL